MYHGDITPSKEWWLGKALKTKDGCYNKIICQVDSCKLKKSKLYIHN